MARSPFATTTYEARARSLSLQRLVNLYPEIQPGGAKARLVLYGTPGLSQFVDASPYGAECKAAIAARGAVYAVVGNSIVKIFSTGDVQRIGGVGTGSGGLVTMAANVNQVLICCPPKVYSIDTLDVVTEVTDPDFVGASSVSTVDGYAILPTECGDTFYISAINDGTDIDALDFASAETKPDIIVRAFVDHREVWFFGETTTEIWYNSGNADFPFQRVSGAQLERGCAAPGSVASFDNTIGFLGDDKIVYRAVGYQAQRISTHAIEERIRKIHDVTDAIAFSYSQAGHSFYCLTFPGVTTFVYDAATQLWHERASWLRPEWRLAWVQPAFGEILAGDRLTGRIFKLDLDAFTEAGDPIRRVAVSPTIHADGDRFATFGLEVEFEPGVGLTTGQGADPQAMLRYSDDDGTTWSKERWTTIGRIGRTKNRAQWNKLGVSRKRVYEVSVSDPVKVAIVAADPLAQVAAH